MGMAGRVCGIGSRVRRPIWSGSGRWPVWAEGGNKGQNEEEDTDVDDEDEYVRVILENCRSTLMRNLDYA